MPGSRVGWWTLLAVHSATFLLGLAVVEVGWGWLGLIGEYEEKE